MNYKPSRTIEVLQKHGVSIDSRAQKVKISFFDEFDYILAMDRQNLQNLMSIKPQVCRAQGEPFLDLASGTELENQSSYLVNLGMER
jgi:protein-tyrosine phosphatase